MGPVPIHCFVTMIRYLGCLLWSLMVDALFFGLNNYVMADNATKPTSLTCTDILTVKY